VSHQFKAMVHKSVELYI